MNDERVPRNTCPECGCPGQLAGLHCGFCHADIPYPTGSLKKGGALTADRIIAWKGMRVQSFAGSLCVIPPMYMQDGPWLPGEWQEATCAGNAPDPATHMDAHLGVPVSPTKNCTCGFYSGRTREHQMRLGYARYTPHNPTVLVEIELAGKIYPADNGFRAQKARPVRFHVPHELWEIGRDLKETYDGHAEVVMGTTIILPKTAIPEWCPKCGAAWEGRGLTCSFCSHELTG